MWRSASSFVWRRYRPHCQQRKAISSLSTAVAGQNESLENSRKIEKRIRPRNCRPFSGKVGDNDGSDEEWIPPVRMTNGDNNEEAVLPKSDRIETILEVSRQVKEQERMDRVIEESQQEAEALFQLTEEEQATLTDEEILERLEEVLKREEELEEALFQKELEEEKRLKSEAAQQGGGAEYIATDWLRNRRAMLGDDSPQSSSSPVPVTRHALLQADEIQLLLEAHGGQDIVVVHDDPEAPRMGGAEGMIFCTAGGGQNDAASSLVQNSPYLISTLSRVLIDHMKDRKLHELGVAPSANQNTTNRAAVSSQSLYGSGFNSPSESWRIVDCGNYIVHILDEATRWDLNLEDLWSGADPLWTLNVFDDDEVEEYCERNPVPSSYNGTGSNADYDHEEYYMDDAAMKKLERTRFGSTRRHKPVISQAIKNRDRRMGRRKRREQRERDYFGSYE